MIDTSLKEPVDTVELVGLTHMESVLDRMTSYAKELYDRADKLKIEELSKLRNIPVSILEEAGVFYIERQSELLLPRYIDDLKDFGVISSANNRPIYNNRWIFPIKNAEGKVINFVGYSNLEDERYVYATGKYYSRTDVLYGLENIREAYKLGYAILTEGITDSLAVRGLGHKNVLAWCGTSSSDFKIKQLNRCRHGIIRVPDRDIPGARMKKVWNFNRYYTLVTMAGFKDSAEMLSQGEEYREHYKACLDISIDWILREEHRGRKCASNYGIM